MSIYIADGSSPDMVEQTTNTPGQMTDIARVNVDRGEFIRILNMVQKGSARGVPFYFKLRDSNGDLLATSTRLQVALSIAGASDSYRISEEIENISQWNSLSLDDQRNTEQIDQTKVVLRQPEIAGGEVVKDYKVRDVDQLAIQANASAAVDWSQSEFYVEPSAVRGPFSR
jgi:hypothetical protein